MLDVSPVYLTEPQGVREQPWFANQVARLALSAPPKVPDAGAPGITEEGGTGQGVAGPDGTGQGGRGEQGGPARAASAPGAAPGTPPDATQNAALGLLRAILAIETRMGRVRGAVPAGAPEAARAAARFGPRIIDLDLLIVESVQCATPELILPHPRLRERAFVLVPLRDVRPDLVFADGTSIDAALARVVHTVRGNRIRQ